MATQELQTVSTRPTFFKDILAEVDFVWKTKSLRYGLFANLLYLLTIIVAYYLSDISVNFSSELLSFDFRIFYTSFLLVRSDPTLLYSSDLYAFPFRYLPFFSYFHSYISLIPYSVAFALHTVFMIFLHLFSFLIILVLCKRFYGVDLTSKRRKSYLLIAIVSPLQIPNLVFGQITEIYIILLLLCVLLKENELHPRYNVKRSNFLSGLLCGCAMLYKPFGILLIPLLISLSFRKHDRKLTFDFRSTLPSLFGIFLPFFPNLLIWAVYPNLLLDFININRSAQILAYPSSSIIRILEVLLKFIRFSIPQEILILILSIFIFGAFYGLFLIFPSKSRNFSLFFGVMHFILLIAYPDSWFLYFHIWLFLILPGLFRMEDRIGANIPNRILESYPDQISESYPDRISENPPTFISKTHLHRNDHLFTRKFQHFSTTIFLICNYGAVYFIFGIAFAVFVTKIDFIFPFLVVILAILFFKEMHYLRKCEVKPGNTK